MNLVLSEEQEMLRTSGRDFLTDKLPKTTVKEIEQSEKGYSPELWQEIAGLGWMGLAFPEKYDGADMNFLDLAILIEEMGRACLPAPFFSTVVLGGLSILDAGSEAQKQEYLPRIAGGEAIFSLALTEPSARYDAAAVSVKATAQGDSYVLDGIKLFVPYAHIADYMLVVARTDDKAKPEDGITVFIVDAKSPGINTTVLKSMSPDKPCEVVFNQVNVAAANILGQLNQGWNVVQKILERAAVAKCCEMVGGMQQVLDMTVDYAKERKQFGRPIGSFQIIQHYAVDILTDMEGLRLSTYQAAWRVSEGLPCAEQVAIAKAWAGEASERVISLSHQIHGAIGWTVDHDLHYYTRRAKAAEATFGNADFYREIVAREMGL